MSTPSYDRAIAERICDSIAQGSTLVAALAAEKISTGKWFFWLEREPECSELYARARESRGELLAEGIVAHAMTASNDNAQAVRIQVDAMKWAAARLAPKRWGDRAAVEVSGKDGGPVTMALVVRDVGSNNSEDSEK